MWSFSYWFIYRADKTHVVPPRTQFRYKLQITSLRSANLLISIELSRRSKAIDEICWFDIDHSAIGNKAVSLRLDDFGMLRSTMSRAFLKFQIRVCDCRPRCTIYMQICRKPVAVYNAPDPSLFKEHCNNKGICQRCRFVPFSTAKWFFSSCVFDELHASRWW